MAEPNLKLSNVSKIFARVDSDSVTNGVTDVNLEFNKGEFLIYKRGFLTAFAFLYDEGDWLTESANWDPTPVDKYVSQPSLFCIRLSKLGNLSVLPFNYRICLNLEELYPIKSILIGGFYDCCRNRYLQG